MGPSRSTSPRRKFQMPCWRNCTLGPAERIPTLRQRVNLLAPSRIRQSPKSLFPYLFAGLFLLAFFDSWQRAGIDPKVFFEPRGQRALGKFLTGMFPPDLPDPPLRQMKAMDIGMAIFGVYERDKLMMIGFPLG